MLSLSENVTLFVYESMKETGNTPLFIYFFDGPLHGDFYCLGIIVSFEMHMSDR